MCTHPGRIEKVFLFFSRGNHYYIRRILLPIRLQETVIIRQCLFTFLRMGTLLVVTCSNIYSAQSAFLNPASLVLFQIAFKLLPRDFLQLSLTVLLNLVHRFLMGILVLRESREENKRIWKKEGNAISFDPNLSKNWIT